MNGFSFNGKHCSEFGLFFIPSPANRQQSVPDYDIIESTVTGRDGGYYYRSQTKIRDFSLECYFEGISIETFEKMMVWLHQDAYGDQVFDDRPFVAYSAVVWKRPVGKVYSTHDDGRVEETYSGTMTVYFKCHNPYGKMLYTSYEDYDADDAMKHCGIISKSEMPPTVDTELGTYLIYNPGTELCNTIIRVGGSAPNGLTISNSNGDKCVITSLPTSGYLEINSDYGTVKLMPKDEMAFEFHNDGFIRLSPCTPYDRDVVASFTADSNIVTLPTFSVNKSLVGKYIRLSGEWIRISSITSDGNIIIGKRMQSSGVEQTMIVSMNEQTLSGDNASLNKFEIDYVPLLR